MAVYRTFNGVEVDAYHWIGKPTAKHPLPEWLGQAVERNHMKADGDRATLTTISGIMIANPGDWIVRAPYDGLGVYSPRAFSEAFGSA
jgi:hypothetical protein